MIFIPMHSHDFHIPGTNPMKVRTEPKLHPTLRMEAISLHILC